jgi:hypothetical protein
VKERDYRTKLVVTFWRHFEEFFNHLVFISSHILKNVNKAVTVNNCEFVFWALHMEHLFPYFWELFTRWCFDEVHFPELHHLIYHSFSVVPTCLGIFTRWYFLWWSSFFGELHVPFVFIWFPHIFWGTLFHYVILWWSSFSRNFNATCTISAVVVGFKLP